MILKEASKSDLLVIMLFCLDHRHLPLALVAAFAKRFSRLLLVAPPPDQLILMTFIGNLLIRHRDLVYLFHNPKQKERKLLIIYTVFLSVCTQTKCDLLDGISLQAGTGVWNPPLESFEK